MTKPLNTQLSQRESAQPRSARRPRTWLVALLGFGAADLLVLNLWAVPSLITNTTTTDMRAAQSGEGRGAAADPEPQPQAAVPAQPAESHAADSPTQPAQAMQESSPSHYGAQHAEAQPAQQRDSAAQLAAPQDDRAVQGEPSEPGHYAAVSPRGSGSAQQAEATSSRGTRAAQVDTAAQRAARVAQEGAPATQQRTAPGQAELPRAAAARPGDSASQPVYGAAAQAEMQRLAAERLGDSAAQAGEQRRAAARPSDPASHGAAAQAAEQRGAAPGDSAARAAPTPEGAQAAADAPQQAEPSAEQGAARDEWAARAPRAEAPPGGAPPTSREVADLPSDPAVARAFAMRAAQRAVRVALTDRNAFRDNGPFDALTVADQPLAQIFFSMGNFTLGPNGKQMLERKLPQLTSDERPILIVGAADPSGPEQINEKLSDARAQSVAEWLLAHGVDAQRIQTHAIGHEGAVGSTLDRRVDIWLGGSR